MTAWPAPRGASPCRDVNPHLVLDGFQTRLGADHEPADLAPAHAVLRLARLSGWPVAHVMRRPPDDRFDPDDPAWRPLAGFEPAPHDMCFVTQGRTIFASRHFTDRFVALRPQLVLFLSLASRSSCLETLASARERGIPFFLVKEDRIISAYPDDMYVDDVQSVLDPGTVPADGVVTGHLQRFARGDARLRLAGG